MARGRSGQSGAIHARGRRHIFPMLAVAAVLASFAAAALGFLPVFAQEEGAVSGLTLTSDSPGTLAMSWDVPDQTPTDYRVNWGKSAEDFPSYAENDGNAYPTTNSHTVTGLDEGIEYKVRVRARYRGDELNEGQTQWSTPWSEAANITIASQAPEATPVPTPEPVDSAPAAPTGLTAAAAHDSVTITWTAPAGSTVTGYQILRRQTGVDEPGDFQVHVDDTGNTDTTYTDTDVEAESPLRLPGQGQERRPAQPAKQLRQCRAACVAGPRLHAGWGGRPGRHHRPFQCPVLQAHHQRRQRQGGLLQIQHHGTETGHPRPAPA